jgi:S-adenosyl-L-methionine hydrolase (adenosine-forming)
VHRVITAHAPGVPIVDVTHQIPAHDVRAGALTLWRAAPWLVPGVILAVVDPGVGTARRGVAVEVASAGAVLVGPDNGLLLPAALALGPISAAVALRDPGPPEASGATFAGRDLFAPVSAALATGADLHRLGTPVDPAGLVGEPIPTPAVEAGGRLRTQVLWVDRFGNAQLNARSADAAHLGPEVGVAVGPRAWTARRAAAYGDLGGGVGLVIDSYGLLSISCDRASAADVLGLRPGDEVWLDPLRRTPESRTPET